MGGGDRRKSREEIMLSQSRRGSGRTDVLTPVVPVVKPKPSLLAIVEVRRYIFFFK